MYDTSSWFQVQLENPASEPVRKFSIGTSDYSNRVAKWPRIKRTMNDVKSLKVTMPVENVDGHFNGFYEDVYTIPNTGTLEMGFGPKVSNSGLVGFWDLDDGTGSTAIDQSGNGNNGTLHNMEEADWIDGKAGKCLSFDGTSEYVDCGNLSGEVAQNGPASIVGWFYFTQFANAKGANIEIHPQLYQHSTNDYFYLGGGGADYFAVGASLSINTWYHIALTYNGTHETARLYVDGVEYSVSIQSADTNHAILNPFRISNTNFPGRIDEIRVYNRVLSASEIQDLYDNPGLELVTLYTGFLKNVSYKKEICDLEFRDNLNDFQTKKVGDSDASVVFSSQIPSDIGWDLCTSYGGLSSVASTSNPDIDYTSFLGWAESFSADSVLVEAQYDGMKVTQAVNNLAKMTDSAIWVEGDGKINFLRPEEPTSLDITFTRDHFHDIEIDVESLRVINKAWIYWNYAVESDYFQSKVFAIDSASINTYSLQEEIFKNESIWYVNSVSALVHAQRKTTIFRDPPKRFIIDTNLYGMRHQLGETVRLVDSFYNVNSSAGWRLIENELNMETGEIIFEMDEAATLMGFYLDTSLLDGDEVLL